MGTIHGWRASSQARAIWAGVARLHGMSPADRQGSGFGETEMLDLARPDQILYRSGDVLDGHIRIDAILVQQVEGVGPQGAVVRLRRLP